MMSGKSALSGVKEKLVKQTRLEKAPGIFELRGEGRKKGESTRHRRSPVITEF